MTRCNPISILFAMLVLFTGARTAAAVELDQGHVAATASLMPLSFCSKAHGSRLMREREALSGWQCHAT